MANSTNQILNKSLSELRKKQTSLFKEIENIATAISSIENIIVPEQIININSKNKSNNKTYYKKFTEEQVRDAIIYIDKNPPEGNLRFKTKSGWFTIKYILNQLGYSRDSNPNVSSILSKFESKGIVESAPYKRGKQYKYIPPTVTGPGKEFEQSKAISLPVNISTSAPVPGTGKNWLTLRNKDIEKLVNKAISEGFTAERLGSDHLRISKSGKIATISTTGTDKARYVENCRSDLKRIGVQV